jgi:hypothetical protein
MTAADGDAVKRGRFRAVFQRKLLEAGVDVVDVAYTDATTLRLEYRTTSAAEPGRFLTVVGGFFGLVRRASWVPAKLQLHYEIEDLETAFECTVRSEWCPPDDSEQAWREALERVDKTEAEIPTDRR